MGEKIPEVANVDRTKDIQEHGLLKCHSTTLPIPERATRSERADGLGKSLSGLWHREVSESGTEAAVRAAVSKVLPVIEGLSWHTGDCPVGPRNSTDQCRSSRSGTHRQAG